MASTIPSLLLLVAVGVSLYDPAGLASGISARVFDAYQMLKPRPVQTEAAAVYIDIDAETTRRLGSWPWPHTRLAHLLDATRRAGARLTVIDLPVAEPDPTSPRQALRTWSPLPPAPDMEGLIRGLAALPDHDEELARQIATMPTIVSFAPGKTGAPRLPAALAHGKITGGEIDGKIPDYETWRASLRTLEQSAKGNGATLPDQVPGARIREFPLVVSLNGALYPSNILEAARLTRNDTDYDVEVQEKADGFAFGIVPGIRSVATGQIDIPSTPDGTLRLYNARAGHIPTLPAWQLIAGDLKDAPSLSGRIAVLGLSTNGSDRRLKNAAGNTVPQGMITAGAIDQILDGQFLIRPDWAPSAEQIALLFGGFAIILTVIHLSAAWGTVLTFLLVASACGGSWWVFQDRHWLIEPAYGSTMFVVLLFLTSLLDWIETEAQTRLIENQFSRRLSARNLRRIVSSPQLMNAEGKPKEVTSLVCGLRGFNVISDRYLETPAAFTDILNRFFTPTTQLVLERNGMVDRYIGDRLLAVWNAPIDETDHAIKACDAALRMTESLDHLNEFLEEDARRNHLSHIPLSVNIGIDTGKAVAGNMGAFQRFDYGVLGEPVNFAGHLEKHARTYGPAIIVGEGTERLVGSRYALLEIDLVSTPRHPDGWHIYALLGDPIMRASPKFKALQEAHRAFFAAYRNQQWAEARAIIQETRKLTGAIATLYDLYETRIAQYEAAPPAPGWNGAWYAGRL